MNSLLCTCLSVILSVPIYRIGSSFMIQIKHACMPISCGSEFPLPTTTICKFCWASATNYVHRKKKDQGGPHEECAKLCEYLDQVILALLILIQ